MITIDKGKPKAPGKRDAEWVAEQVRLPQDDEEREDGDGDGEQESQGEGA